MESVLGVCGGRPVSGKPHGDAVEGEQGHTRCFISAALVLLFVECLELKTGGFF